jgi:hypothetical protein
LRGHQQPVAVLCVAPPDRPHKGGVRTGRVLKFRHTRTARRTVARVLQEPPPERVLARLQAGQGLPGHRRLRDLALLRQTGGQPGRLLQSPRVWRVHYNHPALMERSAFFDKVVVEVSNLGTISPPGRGFTGSQRTEPVETRRSVFCVFTPDVRFAVCSHPTFGLLCVHTRRLVCCVSTPDVRFAVCPHSTFGLLCARENPHPTFVPKIAAHFRTVGHWQKTQDNYLEPGTWDHLCRCAQHLWWRWSTVYGEAFRGIPKGDQTFETRG